MTSELIDQLIDQTNLPNSTKDISGESMYTDITGSDEVKAHYAQ